VRIGDKKRRVIVNKNEKWEYFNKFNPVYLNYICTLNGHYPIQIENGFNYCELGCRVGVTLNGLAELFPKGHFLGIDNNIDYINRSVTLAEEIGCSNINFKCLNFNELSQPKLSDFDFIILNDVYSWVDKVERQHIQTFILNHLKEDGILYLNYEALPGGSAIEPLRDMIFFHTKGIETDNSIKVQSAIDYLDFMQTNNADCFSDNLTTSKFFNDIKSRDINYAAHRLFNNNFQPYYFYQIMQEMEAIGLSFSGSAICYLNFIDLAVPSDFQPFLKNVTSREQFETHGDFIRNQGFRKDLFINSNKTLDEQEQLEVLSEIIFGTTCSENDFELMVVFGGVELSYDSDIFRRLIRILSDTPLSPVSLLACEHLKGFSLEVIIDALKFLTSGGQVLPVRKMTEGQVKLNLVADRYSIPTNSNIQFLKNRLFKQEKITLISPKASIGLEVTMADAVFALCMAEARRVEVVDWVIQRLMEANQEIITDGHSERDTIAAGFEEFQIKCLPTLLRLGILEPVDN
jgi:hypothetical protein